MGACGQAEACLAGLGWGVLKLSEDLKGHHGPHTTQKVRILAVSAPRRHEVGPQAAHWALRVLGGFPLLEWFL